MLVPTLDNLRVDGREVDLAELQEVLVGPLEHVHDCSPFVRDPRERDDGHPLYGLASGGPGASRDGGSANPTRTSERASAKVRASATKCDEELAVCFACGGDGGPNCFGRDGGVPRCTVRFVFLCDRRLTAWRACGRALTAGRVTAGGGGGG